MDDSAPLGRGPSMMHAGDADARTMTERGYWLTDYAAAFTDELTFRAGRWKATTVSVHKVGEISLSPDHPLAISEHGRRSETEARYARRPPPGRHSVYVSSDAGRLLALLIRVSEAEVAGFAPALVEGTPMPPAPYLPMWAPASGRLVLAQGEVDRDFDPADLRHGVCALDASALGLEVRTGESLMSWWGLDSDGAVAAFVLDASGGALREHRRRQPTREDPRPIGNSCSRIPEDDVESLVRRLRIMAEREMIVLQPGADPRAIASAFFAQRNGNLREWLVQAAGVDEVYYGE